MNHFRSLSDSSTSESEEDGKRQQQHALSYEARMARKRGISTDDTEDEHSELFSMPKIAKTSEFKNPAKYVERDLSDSESDEKASFKNVSSMKPNSSMPTKDNLSDSYGVGMKLMEKMGYKIGTGLGKSEQGIVDIIQASKQRGRRGLGLQLAGLEPSDEVAWDSGKDQVYVQEPIEWIPECQSEPLKIAGMREWILEGEKKINIADETEFCDPEILKNVLAYKSVFDQLEDDEMRKARTRSNPFETIRGGMFLNRAAMKMANMDAAFDFMFTNPKTVDGEPAVTDNELLYFADVCAGPGGFSEYVLWRKKWESKGFGFTLKGPNDFKLEDFFAGPPETFEPYYGVTGDGNIYKPENLRDFKKFVLTNTDKKGVHFVMADGGFSVEGQENEQEILSKRLYLCQFLCALSILRTGGHFVCKLFDLFTPFSVGLVYLMYHAFEKVCIFKPNTSRPANSERYIVCKWLKEGTRDICDYMYEVNDTLEKYSSPTCDSDVNEVVPLYILKQNEKFYEYIVNSNNTLGTRQIIHLDKIRAFAQNTELHDERQNELRKQCLKFWQVPDKARSAPSRPEARAKYQEILHGESLNLTTKPVPLDETSMQKLKSVFEFHCVVCGESDEEKTTLFLGLGRSNIYRLNKKNNNWQKTDATLELPANTLFYGELVSELKGEGKSQRKITCLHIIDAICLGGKDVRKNHFTIRMKLAQKLAKAVSKPSKPDYMPLRVKRVFELRNIEDVFECLALRLIKNSQVPRLSYEVGFDNRHIIPTGLLIFRTIKDPWVIAFSKSQQKPYYFNTKKNRSSFELVDEANADFMSCFSNRLLWNWGRGVQLIPDQDIDESQKHLIHYQHITTFVHKQLSRIMGTFCSS